MWETIVELAKSGDLWLVVVILVLGFIAARQGYLKYKGDKLSLGRDMSENERTIIKNQTEHAKWYVEAFEKEIPDYEGYDIYHGKYIIEVIYDEVVKWVVFNHIQNTQSYIKIKQRTIWSIVQTMTTEEVMRTSEFKKKVYKGVEELIKDLVAIREEYSK